MVKVEGKLEKKNSNKSAQIYQKNDLTKTIIMAFIGLVLILIPSDINKIFGIIVGILLLSIGLSSIFNYIKSKINFTPSLISGILYTLLGIIIFLSPSSVVRSIAIVIGLILVVAGLSKIKLSFMINSTRWIGTLLIGITTLVLGIILIFSPFSSDAITKFTGAILLVAAIFDLLDRYILQK